MKIKKKQMGELSDECLRGAARLWRAKYPATLVLMTVIMGYFYPVTMQIVSAELIMERVRVVA